VEQRGLSPEGLSAAVCNYAETLVNRFAKLHDNKHIDCLSQLELRRFRDLEVNHCGCTFRLLISARQSAQDVVEYGILVASIAMIVLLGITAFGTQVEPWFGQLASRITTVGT
jgi:Flp pilus assembly pilin Flp